jgi:hypothetical protein
VLREEACSSCHAEHVELGARTSTRAFTHELVPEDVRDNCHRCHSAGGRKSHAIADAVECSTCHDDTTWSKVQLDHGTVAKEACDLCHHAPETPAHASVAGTCQECHETSSWTPKPTELKE